MIRFRFPRRVADRRGGGNRPTGTGPAEAGPTRPAIEGAAARHEKSRANAGSLVCRQTGFHARPLLFVATGRSCSRSKGRSTCPRLSWLNMRSDGSFFWAPKSVPGRDLRKLDDLGMRREQRVRDDSRVRIFSRTATARGRVASDRWGQLWGHLVKVSLQN
ncbi:protein of unknown function [Thauera humireducens]|nr:protein of unknown function [Thauera humireducens]